MDRLLNYSFIKNNTMFRNHFPCDCRTRGRTGKLLSSVPERLADIPDPQVRSACWAMG